MPAKTATTPSGLEPATLEEAIALIKRLQAEQEQAEQKLEEKDKQIAEAKKQEEGWLIYTPNPLYDGMVYGVEFKSGAAFVPATKEFPNYQFPKSVKKGVLDKMTADEKATWEQRSKLSSAYRVVELILDDFHYDSIYISEKNAEKLQEFQAKRAKERAEAERAIAALENVNNTVSPGAARINI